MSSVLSTVPDKYSPILGRMKIIDADESNYYLTSDDTSFKIKIGYAVDSDSIENTIFKYRINGGSFTPDNSSYAGYQSEHTFTNITLSEGDIVEAIVTVKLEGNVYLTYPRTPLITTVIAREAITDIKLMRRDFEVVLKNVGFNIYHIPINPDTRDCECIDPEFGVPNAYCEICDGLGFVGGYDLATTIKAVLQEEVPYALHGDAIIFTRIGVGERKDAAIFLRYDTDVKSGDIIFYKNYRWKVLNNVMHNYGGAPIYWRCDLTKEFGMEDTIK